MATLLNRQTWLFSMFWSCHTYRKHRSAKMPTKLFLFVLIIFLTASLCDAGSRQSNKKRRDGKVSKLFNGGAFNKTDDSRRGKLFSLFNVVTFTNGPCASSATVNGRNRNGTCYTSTECADRGGNANGNCAAGFGVCCLFILDGSGSTTISQNCSYIQNTGFPTAVTGASTQTFTIQKCSDDVCYLRLDFETFTLLGTNGSTNNDEGVCTDTFTVTTPTAMSVPTICGENTGQHIYVDIGANNGDTATFTFTTTATAANRLFDIKVTQVECSNESSPRDSCCLQYHTGCTGRLTSFNYANTNDNHLNNQQYQICIRQECGFCCVEYTVCNDQRFALPATTAPGAVAAGFSFDTSNNAARNDAVCADNTNSRDYIGIQESGNTCSMAGGDCDRAINSRYCGFYLNQVAGIAAHAPICDCTAPFGVDVFFNSNSDQNAIAGNPNTKQSRGFCLDYTQVPC